MKSSKSSLSSLTGIVLIGLYFLINLATICDYSVTWDFTYHFNAGLWHIKHTLTDPNFVMGPSPPLSDIMPTLSHYIFHEILPVLDFDSAYNFYSVAMGTLGIGILYFMLNEIFNFQIAFFSSITLAFLPRYFGHLHNNMKDVPQAVMFAFALWMFWRLWKYKKKQHLIIASFALALAVNSKVNGIFVPLIAGSYLAVLLIKQYLAKKKISLIISKKVLSYFILAPLVTLALWWSFWNDPFGRLLEAKHSYTTSTTNMPILYFGKIVYSGQNVPWHYPLGVLSVTTPVLTLVFFVFGLATIFYWKKISYHKRLLVLLWLAVPLARYLKLHMVVIDDIRHFMECIFPFAAIAGIGAYRTFILTCAKLKKVNSFFTPSLVLIILSTLYIFYLAYQNISYHPYQTSYYNELIGGVKGAVNKFDIEFWASAYKPSLQFLNKNAPLNAKITVAMAPDIAKLYLREDLRVHLNEKSLAGAESAIYFKSDYTVILNRESFFNWYGIYPYIKGKQPVYTLSKKGAPLVWIYKN